MDETTRHPNQPCRFFFFPHSGHCFRMCRDSPPDPQSGHRQCSIPSLRTNTPQQFLYWSRLCPITAHLMASGFDEYHRNTFSLALSTLPSTAVSRDQIRLLVQQLAYKAGWAGRALVSLDPADEAAAMWPAGSRCPFGTGCVRRAALSTIATKTPRSTSKPPGWRCSPLERT